MKRNLIGILSLVVMSMLASATGAYAQSVRANVPFAFRVGSKQLPAGAYKISMTSDNAIAIGNGQTSAVLVMVRRETPRNSGNKLVFHHLGGQYFLAAIWRDADSGMAITPSKQEKNLEKELQLASGKAPVGEDVLIALN
jgi:hypothetical protein